MNDVERQIAETIASVSSALARAGAPADVEDIIQEGWLIALQALAGFDAARGALPPYLRAILRPSIGKAVARWSEPCSISDHRARSAVKADMVDLEELDADDFSGDDLPLSPEQLLAVAEARARAAAAIAEVFADMGKRAAELVALDPEATSDDVGALAGVSGRRVRLARTQFRERAERSAELRDLARAVA